jgi:hypothetical protein
LSKELPEVTETAEALRNEIKIEAAGSTGFELEAFARVFSRRLEEAEQVYDVNVEPLRCNGPRGRRLEILGYAEDATDGSLLLLAGRYFGNDETLTLTDARDAMGRATAFFESAVNGWIAENLEASSRESEYAEYFARQASLGAVARLRVALITDGIMSNRIRTIESGIVAGLKTTYEIWDQRRILDAALPEQGSEDIHVDFTRWLPGGLPCLIAESDDSATQTYLAVIPARLLAEVFDEYGSLLLESNVRTFLSARGAVNKGIQATLAQQPDRFLAYNNGLTTTATAVEIEQSAFGAVIRSIDRWQIVNGGQTTASIVHYLRGDKSRSVDDVQVQMKLVTVTDADAASIVQAVAKYANSQNRVSGADLFATHEFHVRMEQISRRLRAPAREGQQYQSGWYYERARGQWENDRSARGTAGEQKKFDLEYPKLQRVTKTDWAKYAYSWGQKPHLVSKGAQSVFADYAVAVDKAWKDNDDQFGDDYFRINIGKAIMFETLRMAILKQDWYRMAPGYLANIVAYAIARFALQIETQFHDLKYDFGRVWAQQTPSEITLAALLDVARLAQRHLTDESRPQANVTQWAKQQACWDQFARVQLRIPPGVDKDLIGKVEVHTQAQDARKQRAMDSGFEATRRVLAVSADVWHSIYGTSHHITVSPMERDLVQMFGLHPGKVPSERQAGALLRLLGRMADNGVIPPDSF